MILIVVEVVPVGTAIKLILPVGTTIKLTKR